MNLIVVITDDSTADEAKFTPQLMVNNGDADTSIRWMAMLKKFHRLHCEAVRLNNGKVVIMLREPFL